MRTVAYYRKQAAECRAMARQMGLTEDRDRLITMAHEWEKLAEDREAELGLSAPKPAEAASDPRHKGDS